MAPLLCLLLILSYFLGTIVISDESTVVHEWLQVDYDWHNSTNAANKSYIMKNNIITGIKLYQDRMFVTVPRWRYGVPSTLNEVVIDTTNKSVLKAYPSWKHNTIDDCNYLQNIQSMEVTPDGKMWIVDVGRKYFYDDYYNISNLCPPKLWIYNINENTLERSYIFPSAVAQYNNSFLNDIVVDYVDKIAYISDVFGSPFNGGIVVYDYNNNSSKRYTDISMKYDGDNSAARTVIINDDSVYTTTAIDGIALSADRKYLYYSPLSSFRTYRVPSYNVRYYEDDYLGEIEYIGNRTSQMDGMTFSNESILYFGSFHETGVYQMEYQVEIDANERDDYTKQNSKLLVGNNFTLQWIDTFAWGDHGYLYFTTNRLHRYFENTMDWSGNEGANFRIMKVYVGASSYLNYTETPTQVEDILEWVIIIIICALVGIFVIGLIVLLIFLKRRKQKRSSQVRLLDQEQLYTSLKPPSNYLQTVL